MVGSRGTLIWDGRDSIRAEVARGPRPGLFDAPESLGIPPLDPADRIGGHFGVMSDFVGAVRGGGEPETVGHDNIRSLAMALGAIRSSEAGRRIDIVI